MIMKRIEVSDSFVEIYKHFNVFNQIKSMKKLSKRELYLLLMFCLDKHDEDNPVVKLNFQPFYSEIRQILNMIDDKKISSTALKKLIKETGEYVDTDNIFDKMGRLLPEPYTKEEIREVKINIINRNNRK